MAGHKRPHGFPVCPPRQSPGPLTGKSREPTPDYIPRIGDTYHLRNPNYIENFTPSPPPEFTRERSGSPCTWVSTEPADDIPGPSSIPIDHLRRQRPAQELELAGYAGPQASFQAYAASTTARIGRTLSTFITNHVPPAVTLFSAPRENVQSLTRTARMNGLHTGIMRRPRREGRSPEGIGRRASWWVLMGRDSDAVEHLISLQEQATMARLDERDNRNPRSTMLAHSSPQATSYLYLVLMCCLCSICSGVVVLFIWSSILS